MGKACICFFRAKYGIIECNAETKQEGLQIQRMEAILPQDEQEAAEVEEGEIPMDQELSGVLAEILDEGGVGRVLGEEEYENSVGSFLDPPNLVKEDEVADGHGVEIEKVVLPDGDPVTSKAEVVEEGNSTNKNPKLPTNTRKVIFSQKSKKAKKPSKSRKASKAKSSRGKPVASEDKN